LCLTQPKNYLDFITNYKRILSTQRKDNLDTTARLSSGLAKLTQVSSEVDALQQELSKAKVVVEAATKECNELLQVRGWSRATAVNGTGMHEGVLHC
jgi:dynein heavy chain